jgi:hypothetical protein
MRNHSLLAIAASLLSACGGSSYGVVASEADKEPSAVPADAVAIGPDVIETATNVSVDDARLFLTTQPSTQPEFHRFVLEPAIWPRVGQDPMRPALAAGHSYRLDDGRIELVPWFQLASPMSDVALTALSANEIVVPEGLKVISTIQEVADHTFTIPIGFTADVEQGDIYFVMNATTSGGRLGDRIGAMATVAQVERDSATLVIRHAHTAPRAGDIVMFVQSRIAYTPPETTLYFAPLESDAADTGQLSPLAVAVPPLLAEFGISNILFATLPQYLDPEIPDAGHIAEHAVEAIVNDDDAFGAVAFGRVDDQTLIFNAGSWGSAIGYGGLIGILPGGLRIHLESDLETATTQLAPSFVATGLAMRGDHALAVYLLEIATRNPGMQADVRYHLREHIAVRWLDLGRADETLRLLEHDVEESARMGAVRAQLNALSVLISVYHQLGNCDSVVAAARQFLSIAQQEIPLVARASELTRLAFCLRDLDSPDAAAAAEEALDALRESGDVVDRESLMSLEFRLAEGSLEDLRDASTMLQPRMVELDPQQQVNFLLLQARAFAEVGDATEAQMLAGRALEVQAQNELEVTDQMTTALALIYLFTDNRLEAGQWLTRAAATMLADGEYNGAAQFLYYASRVDFGLLSADGYEPTPEFVSGLERKLDTSCRLYRILGNSQQAGECMATLALLQTAMGRHEDSIATFDQAAFHMVRSANLFTLIDALETRTSQMERSGAADAAASLEAILDAIDIRALIEERYPGRSRR